MRFAPALIDLLLTRGPQRADDIANLLLTGDRQRARCRRRNSAAKRVALRYLRSCSWWYRIGGKADTLGWRDKACGPYRFMVRGRWDTNRTCNLRFWRSRRCVLYSLVQSHNDEYSCAFMCIRSHSVPFRFIALLPFLLPEKVTTSPQYVHVKTPSCSVWSRLRCWYPGSFNDA